MNSSIYYLCCLDTINMFYDEVFQKIRVKVSSSFSNCISVELTSYANYCMELLKQNGLSLIDQAREALAFMWEACPTLALSALGYSNCSGEWRIEGSRFFLDIELA
ncbi:MAG: hypothetical protein K2H40_11630 [Lachnospiraceae bacterium]|nr:hypothetical protein [Lachnospiraceae bacterium]